MNHSQDFLLSFALARDRRSSGRRSRHAPRADTRTDIRIQKPISTNRTERVSLSTAPVVRADLRDTLGAAGIDADALGPLPDADFALLVDAALNAAEAEAPLLDALDAAVDVLGAEVVRHHLLKLAENDPEEGEEEGRRAEHVHGCP